MPDAWETSFGLNPDDPSDAGDDPDGDRISNRNEFLSGTNPQSSASALRFETARLETSEVVLQFRALSGRSYTVEHRGPSGYQWTRLQDVDPDSAERLMTVRDTRPVEDGRLYRLVTPAATR